MKKGTIVFFMSMAIIAFASIVITAREWFAPGKVMFVATCVVAAVAVVVLLVLVFRFKWLANKVTGGDGYGG